MAQFGRPDSDVTTTGVGGGTYASIDETSASDADFDPTNGVLTLV